MSKARSAPTAVQFGRPAQPTPPGTQSFSKSGTSYDQERRLAGHFLRRLGFGPSQTDLEEVLSSGTTAYLDRQLDPASIDDSVVELYLDAPTSGSNFENTGRWYTRMAHSKRQLREKMTLFWHEHFATSIAKVERADFMARQEALFREHALGDFRQLLIEITKDPAMLVWLDNNNNSGRARDGNGGLIPPNENYARELMQLYSLGTTKLNMDGSPVLGTDGVPVPAYTESDVREIARALTGWSVKASRRAISVVFKKKLHDDGNKTILGSTLAGRKGPDGVNEVEDVVDLIMQQASVAPFIAKELILKLATETPTAGYVQRVASVFEETHGDIKSTVRAVFADPEFVSDAVVQSQFKTPVEVWVSAARALANEDPSQSYQLFYGFYEFTARSKHFLYSPPSVLGFYRPGQKSALVNTGLAVIRDTAIDQLLFGGRVTPTAQEIAVGGVDIAGYIETYSLDTPEKAVDFFAERLLTAPLQPEVRQDILDYMGGFVSEDRARAAVWLLLCSPDFQVN